MSFFEEMKKSISEELAEAKPGDTKKIKENSKDDTISVSMPILTSDNIEEYIESCQKDDKGRPIISDDIFDKYYRILDGCINESRTKLARHGGILKLLGRDPEADKEIQRKGGEALQAKLKQRRTMAEDIMIMLAKKARPEAIESLGLSPDANNQEAIIASALLQAIDGNMKAQQFIRDTIGEQPTIKQEVDIMTDDDRKLLANISDRLT